MIEALRTLRPYALSYRGGLVKGIASLLSRNVFGTAIPFVMGYAVDNLARDFDLRRAMGFAMALVVLTGLKGLSQYAMRVILIGISRDIEYDLRRDLFAHLIRMSSDFYSDFRTGDIMARATNDLNAVRMMTGPGVMYTIDTVTTAVLAVAVMSWVDWRLTLFALLPAPFVSLMVARFGNYIHRKYQRIQALYSDMNNRVQEGLTGLRVVRAYVQEGTEKRLFKGLNRTYVDEALSLAKVSGIFMPALQSLTGFSFLIVLWYGGYRLLQGEITLGTFLMFNVYLGMLVWPMVAMGWVVSLLQRGRASVGRLRNLLDRKPLIKDPPQPIPIPDPLRGEIRFESVHLKINGQKIIRGIDLTIAAGSTVAIVGHTGSGKSSLVQLIPRIYDPSEGRVVLDGNDIREYRVADLRRNIGFVPQETLLFGATLAENIAFGTPGATEEEIRKAAEAAGLADDVSDFPAGYQTVVGERGITLSGGQKQRTAIARAILRDPAVLILDDALSSVDTLTEERIITALSDTIRSRTTILISHRVSTIRHADEIFVIEEGRVAERGDHSSLLAAGRWYADLYRKQLLEEELESI